jgi:superfamily II DNA or RNA helicase
MSLPQPQTLNDLAPNYAPTLFEPAPSFGTFVPRLVPPVEDEFVQAATTARVLEERWYQTNALEEIDRLFPLGGVRVDGKGHILVAPTGTGKTSIASRAIKKWMERGENVLVTVNLDRLLEQMLDDLRAEGIEPLIEKGEHHALPKFSGRGCVVLASCQSLYPKRLALWPADSFQKMVPDECHEMHYLGAFHHFAEAQVLGLTATPIPAKGKSLKKYFHYPYIKTLSLSEAIEGRNPMTGEYEKPFLSRIKIQPIAADHIDLSEVKVLASGDFESRELDKVIWQHTNEIASEILHHSGTRPTFVFCPRVVTAEAIAAALRDMGAAAASYTSSTPDPKATMAQFERGALQYLVSVNMLVKGVNVRKVACIARVRASLNIGQATQEIGRGTRTCPETGKEDCLILEFNFKVGKKHQLASVIDAILTGDFDPEAKPTKAEIKFRARVRDRMDSLIKSGKELDVLKAAKEAKKQLSEEDARARQARADAKRAKYQRVETRATQRSYDPCAGLNKTASTARDSAAPFVPATPEQLARLADLTNGRFKDFRTSKETADAAIQRIEYDRQNRKISDAQKNVLVDALGFDPRTLQGLPSFVASKMINGRRLEMANELISAGYPEIVKKASVWELAKMHKHVAPAPASE